MMKLKYFYILFIVLVFNSQGLLGQTTLKGEVLDEQGSPITGASVVLDNSISGTITDFDGKFELIIKSELPVTLTVSYIGFMPKQLEVTSTSQSLNITLLESSESLGQIIITSASRLDEKILESPVTIETIGLTELRSTPSADLYSAISNLKGVQASSSSLTLTSINTRGFADIQNFRFVQLIDGMDASAPGLAYPLGGNSGPADIDIKSIELVPGANSALYGANAFNGLLTIETKDPFKYQGISAYIKQGVTSQEDISTNSLTDFGFRYAKAFNNKFAFKINLGILKATDWTANDQSYYISNGRAGNAEQLLALPRDNPNFDAVNVYGDEIQAQVDLDGSGNLTPINRTGIEEKDIIDYDFTSVKTDAALHYRFSDKVEGSYQFKFIDSDAILRHTTIYPLRNLQSFFHRVEVKGSNWNIKAYNNKENTGDSYALLATGAFLEQGRKSNAAFGLDYGAAYRGEVTGVTAANHNAARAYADRDLIPIDSPEFRTLRANTLGNSDISTGGSRFVDRSSVFSTDANYYFESFKDVLDINTGVNFREFTLISEGQLFNDGPNGFDEPIGISEFGGYVQVGKKFAQDRISLRGSLRYDKHQEFDGKITPRISGVFSLDKEKNHNIRTSYQTGFRNPSPQEGYINLDIGPAVILGGIQNNIDNFQNSNAAGTIFSGNDIYNGLVTFPSFVAFRQTGDPAVLVLANLQALKQEQNSTWEIGYKGLIASKFLIDLNYYNTRYNDLINRVTTISPQIGKAYLIYTNINEEITSDGVGLGFDYLIGNGFKAGFNYTYTTFNADDAVAKNPGFLPSFNTPENRFNLSFTGANISKYEIGFDLKYRYFDGYTWQSPFGTGEIDSNGSLDVAFNKKFQTLSSILKVGGTNVFNDGYNTVYGGPKVGAIYYVSWTYDQIFSK